MKSLVFILLFAVTFQSYAERADVELREQMVCLGNNKSNPFLFVFTQSDVNAKDGETLFHYPNDIFKITDVSLTVEVFKSELSFKSLSKESLKTKILNYELSDRLDRFDGVARRKGRNFKFVDSKMRGNQIYLNFTSLEYSSIDHPDFIDGYVCKDAYKTTYKPLEEPKPGSKDLSGEIHTAELHVQDSCEIGSDPECVEIDHNVTN